MLDEATSHSDDVLNQEAWLFSILSATEKEQDTEINSWWIGNGDSVIVRPVETQVSIRNDPTRVGPGKLSNCPSFDKIAIIEGGSKT